MYTMYTESVSALTYSVVKLEKHALGTYTMHLALRTTTFPENLWGIKIWQLGGLPS